MEFRKSRPISLKAHPVYHEKWLQERLAEDPTLLGLGDLVIKDVERRQPRAGRLDLLMSDPEASTRYVVEVQLGATDEAHIIRTIEYWDIEKARYPQFDHVAVIVAEDITSRFLNVISLFNKAIPLIAIQMRALDVGGIITVNATTVLDLMRLGTDEEDEPGQATDRTYWLNRGSHGSITALDALLEMVNDVTPGMAPKYTKYYIGLARNGVADLYMSFRPRKDYLITEFRIPRSEEVAALLDDSGIETLEYDKRFSRYRIRLTAPEVTNHRDLLLDLMRRASGTPEPSIE